LELHLEPHTLATDNDEAGHALAAAIQSLAPTGAEIRQSLPTIGKDWNDQLRAQNTPTDALGRPQRGVRDVPHSFPTPKPLARPSGPKMDVRQRAKQAATLCHQ
jgi:ABC-type transporter Mla subunit MlaD